MSIHWIHCHEAGSLGIATAPDSVAEVEKLLAQLGREGVDEVVCLMTHEEQSERGLLSAKQLYESEAIRFKEFPVDPGQGWIFDSGTHDFMKALYADLHRGKRVVVYCGKERLRSAVLAAALQIIGGEHPEDALHTVGNALGHGFDWRGRPEEWLSEFSKRFNPFHSRDRKQSSPPIWKQVAVYGAVAFGLALAGFVVSRVVAPST